MTATKTKPKTADLFDAYFRAVAMYNHADFLIKDVRYRIIIKCREKIAEHLSRTTSEMVYYEGHVFVLKENGSVKISACLIPEQVDEKAGE